MSALKLLTFVVCCQSGFGFVDVASTKTNATLRKVALTPVWAEVVKNIKDFMYGADEKPFDTAFDVDGGDWDKLSTAAVWDRLDTQALAQSDLPVIPIFWKALGYKGDAIEGTPQQKPNPQSWVSFTNFLPQMGRPDSPMNTEFSAEYQHAKAVWENMQAAFTDVFQVNMQLPWRRIAIGFATYQGTTCYPWHQHTSQEFYIDITKAQQSKNFKIFETQWPREEWVNGKIQDVHIGAVEACGIVKEILLPQTSAIFGYGADHKYWVFYQPSECSHEMNTKNGDFYGMYVWVFPKACHACLAKRYGNMAKLYGGDEPTLLMGGAEGEKREIEAQLVMNGFVPEEFWAEQAGQSLGIANWYRFRPEDNGLGSDCLRNIGDASYRYDLMLNHLQERYPKFGDRLKQKLTKARLKLGA